MINLDSLHKYPITSVDVESTGLHWYRDRMFGVAVAGRTEDGRIHSGYWDVRDRPEVLRELKIQIPKCKRIVNHNNKFDANFLLHEGVDVPLDRLECTSVRAALINEHEDSFSLDYLGKKHVGEGKVTSIYEELAAMFGGAPTKDVQMKNLHRAPEAVARKYAQVDPELAIKLWLWQEEEIKRQGLEKVWDLERRLMPVLIEMEQWGVRVDEERALRELALIDPRVGKVQKELDRLAGKPMNANSSPQMRALFKVQKSEADGRVIWHTDTGFQLENTGKGEASLGKRLLTVMAEQGDERAKSVLTIRRLIKAKSFLKDHILGHAVNGRVYPNYNQTRGDNELGTGTGRFSIDDPALQQIPARDVDIAAIVRSCFLPEPGGEWACADWEQFEFRWFAHYTQDPNILKAYQDDPNTDYHKIVSAITGIPRNPRFAGDPNAKQINLGLVFGMGEGELAYQMGMDFTERMDESKRIWKNAGPKAKAIFETYHGAIPGVRKLLGQATSIARSRGFVKTVMERHLRFPHRGMAYKAGGLVFQGTSADCMKVKMIENHALGKQHGYRTLLSVHDELDFNFPKKSSKKLQAVVKKSLECFDGVGCPISCRVPILSSIKSGPTWWDACKKD